MLVFFIHGVATRTNQYAEKLKDNLKEEFHKKHKTIPYFYSSVWGGLLGDTDPLWNFVQKDLTTFKNAYKIGMPDISRDIFQYCEYREFFITHFLGDLFTYLNPDCGKEIRKCIATQLIDFLDKYPQETELHFVAHSLGGVILWDILFSDKFSFNDPAIEIRKMIKGLSSASECRKVYLRSITTMGSPILLFNVMLGVDPENIKKFANRYQSQPLRWINIIHASDVLAYPIKASLNIDTSWKIFCHDKFIASHNPWKKLSQPLGKLAGLSMAKGLESSHNSYWKRGRVAHLITANILGNCRDIELASPYRDNSIF